MGTEKLLTLQIMGFTTIGSLPRECDQTRSELTDTHDCSMLMFWAAASMATDNTRRKSLVKIFVKTKDETPRVCINNLKMSQRTKLFYHADISSIITTLYK